LRIATSAALLIIDMQKAIDHPSWGVRNNPGAEANMLRLLAAWRAAGRTVIHVRHVSKEPTSTFRPGQPGIEFKPGFAPLAGETVVEKSVPTAFIGTSLEALLRGWGTDSLVIVGVITNNSVEATARVAGNLGFNTVVVSDGSFTFGKTDFAGTFRSAEEVHAMSLANLNGEYATVLTTDAVLAAIKPGT
jgi:nicotinamidase-related amidase